MKLKRPVEIDFLDFLKNGKFDCIKLGQSKEWIIHNFPDPSDYPNVYKYDIWQYGNIEFHFDKSEKLFLIFSDYLSKLDGGKNLKLNKWELSNMADLTLLHVISLLNINNIDYMKVCMQDDVWLRLRSGVELTFTNLDCHNQNINLYKLNSFSLCDKSLKSNFWN